MTSGIAASLGPLKALKEAKAKTTPAKAAEARVPLPLHGAAKHNHPEYTPRKLFLRNDTYKAAKKHVLDIDSDVSELVERLLRAHLKNSGALGT